jgi:cytochrome c553
MVDLGCITSVERGKARQLAGQDIDTFDLDWLQACAMCHTMPQYQVPSSHAFTESKGVNENNQGFCYFR